MDADGIDASSSSLNYIDQNRGEILVSLVDSENSVYRKNTNTRYSSQNSRTWLSQVKNADKRIEENERLNHVNNKLTTDLPEQDRSRLSVHSMGTFDQPIVEKRPSMN